MSDKASDGDAERQADEIVVTAWHAGKGLAENKGTEYDWSESTIAEMTIFYRHMKLIEGVASVLASSDAALREKDAEIERLRAQLKDKQS